MCPIHPTLSAAACARLPSSSSHFRHMVRGSFPGVCEQDVWTSSRSDVFPEMIFPWCCPEFICQLIWIRIEFGSILVFKIIYWILCFVTLRESCQAVIKQLNQRLFFLILFFYSPPGWEDLPAGLFRYTASSVQAGKCVHSVIIPREITRSIMLIQSCSCLGCAGMEIRLKTALNSEWAAVQLTDGSLSCSSSEDWRHFGLTVTIRRP